MILNLLNIKIKLLYIAKFIGNRYFNNHTWIDVNEGNLEKVLLMKKRTRNILFLHTNLVNIVHNTNYFIDDKLGLQCIKNYCNFNFYWF